MTTFYDFQSFPDTFSLTEEHLLQQPSMLQSFRLPDCTDPRPTCSCSTATTMPPHRISTESWPMPETESKIWRTTFLAFRVKIIPFWPKFQNSHLPVMDVSPEVSNYLKIIDIKRASTLKWVWSKNSIN